MSARACVLEVLCALALGLVPMAQAFTVHRGFSQGYPRGSVPGATPETGATTGFTPSAMGGGGTTRTKVLRKNTFRLVRDPGGDFAVKAATGEAIYLELKEPKGCRWIEPKNSGGVSVVIERGSIAKQRSKGVSGGPETALITLRRMKDGDVDVTLSCRRMGASANETPERVLTVRLARP